MLVRSIALSLDDSVVCRQAESNSDESEESSDEASSSSDEEPVFSDEKKYDTTNKEEKKDTVEAMEVEGR